MFFKKYIFRGCCLMMVMLSESILIVSCGVWCRSIWLLFPVFVRSLNEGVLRMSKELFALDFLDVILHICVLFVYTVYVSRPYVLSVHHLARMSCHVVFLVFPPWLFYSGLWSFFDRTRKRSNISLYLEHVFGFSGTFYPSFNFIKALTVILLHLNQLWTFRKLRRKLEVKSVIGC